MTTYRRQPVMIPYHQDNSLVVPKKTPVLHQDKFLWRQIVSAFPVLCENVREMPEKCDDKQFQMIVHMIINNNLAHVVTGYVMNTIMNRMNAQLSSEVWYSFMCDRLIDRDILKVMNIKIESDLAGFLQFRNAIDEYFLLTQSNLYFVCRLELLHSNRVSLIKQFYERVGALLHSRLPFGYQTLVYNYFRTTLRVTIKANEVVNFESQSTRQCDGCHIGMINCICSRLLDISKRTNWQLNALGIMNSLGSDIIMDLMTQTIQEEVEKTKYHKDSRLEVLEKWLNTTIYKWLKPIFEATYEMDTISNPYFYHVMAKLRQHLREACRRCHPETDDTEVQTFL